MSSESPENHKPEVRPWVGTILSVLVPGVGCFRAGLWKRGFIWASIFFLAPIWCSALLGLDGPTWMFVVFLPIVPILFIWMLVDNTKKGRMNRKVWGVMALIFVASILTPQNLRPSFPILFSTGDMEPTILGYLRPRSVSPDSPEAKPLGTADRIIVSRIHYQFHSIQRGDIIAFDTAGIQGIPSPPNQSIIYSKRVVGMPGEVIRIEDGAVYADDRKLDEADGIPPISYESGRPSQINYSVPEDGLFVLGDNTENSYDSRGWGTVPIENVIGKVTRIYYPLHRIRKPVYDSKEAFERKKEWEALEGGSIAR